MAVTVVATLASAGCLGAMSSGGDGDAWEWQNLTTVPEPDPDQEPQPFRGYPFAVAATPDGQTAFVALRGNEAEPADEIVVVDVPSRSVVRRLRVGDSPVAVRVRPTGDFAVVLSQYSPWAAVIDVESREVVGQLRVGYYGQDLLFSLDGAKMWTTNRMKDEVQEWDLAVQGGTLVSTWVRSAPAGANPDGIGFSPDQSKIYTTDAGGMGLHVYDVATLAEVKFIALNAPTFDVKPMGRWVVATALNDTNGLPCKSDPDMPAVESDGIYNVITDRTCSRGFADLQNEIAFIDPATDEVVIRYTSDTATASEQDREEDHPPELMKVYGSLPQQLVVVDETRAYVTMGASFELVELIIDDSTPPMMTMPRAWDTGFAPRGLAVVGGGNLALVANKLSEDLSIIDLATGERQDLAVGHAEPRFPATTAEVGELFFHTSKFATDGDQGCIHCHPNNENDGKAWGVAVVRGFGRRLTLISQNLRETKPLLIEGVFDENDFSLEVEGISFRGDFHDSSYTLQVARRNEFFLATSQALIGRAISFDEMIRNIGDFLMIEPRLLPNPFPTDTPQVTRGMNLFFRFDVGCFLCHPSPTFASPDLFAGVVTPATYDRPARALDPDISVKYIENARDFMFNANSLRGAWDRRGAFLHDGRAKTMREVILTPGHPCLRPGERGFNEFNGQVDTNGATSHLTCDEIDDLVAFLMTID